MRPRLKTSLGHLLIDDNYEFGTSQWGNDDGLLIQASFISWVHKLWIRSTKWKTRGFQVHGSRIACNKSRKQSWMIVCLIIRFITWLVQSSLTAQLSLFPNGELSNFSTSAELESGSPESMDVFAEGISNAFACSVLGGGNGTVTMSWGWYFWVDCIWTTTAI